MQKLRSSFVLFSLLVAVCFIVVNFVGVTDVLAGSDSKKQEFTAEMLAGKMFKTRSCRFEGKPRYRSIPQMHEESTAYGDGFVTTEEGRLEIPKIRFDFNEYKVRKESEPDMQELAKLISTYYSRSRILIEGHTDDIGTENYNLWLSEKRAQAVVDALVWFGIDRAQLKIKANGETYPLLPNVNDEYRSYNRRISFTTAGAY